MNSDEDFLRSIGRVSKDLEKWCRLKLLEGWSAQEIASRLKRDTERVKAEAQP